MPYAISKFEGIVIGHQDQGDADRLISFYTPYFGKIETVARGVRHEKSKLKGHLELLTHGEFIIAKNRGRGVLTDALASNKFPHMHAHVERAYIGLAVAGMYENYLYPHAQDDGLWRLLADTLKKLNASQELSAGDMPGMVLNFAHAFIAGLGYADAAAKPTGGLMGYDALLAHTDKAGPLFARMERGLRELARSSKMGYTASRQPAACNA